MTAGLEKIHVAQSWRMVRPLLNALTRLGHKVVTRDGPTLWTTPEGATAATMLLMAAQLLPRIGLSDLAGRFRQHDIEMFQSLWNLDASPETLREALQSVLNLQQTEPPP